ncbi:hypothetical protein [Pseudotamlana carrageenivorans]|uniref:Resolvase HTH domain-containing protein n=1 Tax=Pseudotamlana carrageenivorans TaxID=2069432 RepID=A0A2I7SKN3_9FLAO|nr:hypothetical protein [Tamlana carrageenivorans]AUS06453.1 hypothetical protein C1A40_13810 [Tamlana carrageenivorans]
MYRYHPEIEGLKVNENGTEVIYLGEPLTIKELDRKTRPSDLKYVYLKGNIQSVAKLVCECWHGMPDNPRWCATRKVKANGFHFENLYWAPRGTNPEMGTQKVKRSKLSKLSSQDVKDIQERLTAGHTFKAIANDYGTSDMTISRIKKRLQRD